MSINIVRLCIFVSVIFSVVGRCYSYSPIIAYRGDVIEFKFIAEKNSIYRINIHYFFNDDQRDALQSLVGKNSSDRCFPTECGTVHNETFFFTIKKNYNKGLKYRMHAQGAATVQGVSYFSSKYFSRTIHEAYFSAGEYAITIVPQRKNGSMEGFLKEITVEAVPGIGSIEE